MSLNWHCSTHSSKLGLPGATLTRASWLGIVGGAYKFVGYLVDPIIIGRVQMELVGPGSNQNRVVEASDRADDDLAIPTDQAPPSAREPSREWARPTMPPTWCGRHRRVKGLGAISQSVLRTFPANPQGASIQLGA